MLRRLGGAVLLVTALQGCRPSRDIEKIVPPGHDQFAREYIASVRNGDYDRGMAALIPHLLKIPGARDSLAAVVRRIPPGGDSLRLIGVNWVRKKSFDGGDLLESLLVYEYQAPTGWGVITTGVVEEMGVRFITGLRGERYDQSQRAINAFTFAGKSPVHYFVVLLAISAAVASFAYALAAAFTPMPRRWLWALLSLVGGSGLTLNWSTGQVAFSLLSINLFGAGFKRMGAGPWLITAAVPLGAILTAIHLEKIRRQRAANAAPDVRATDQPPPLDADSKPA